MNILLKKTCFLVLCFALFSCGKESTESVKTTTIYGTVFDKKTHEPVVGAKVEIGGTSMKNSHEYHNDECHPYSTSVSGSDGLFELQYSGVVSYPYFYIHVTCDGYFDYFDHTGITEGGTSRMDINIYPYHP